MRLAVPLVPSWLRWFSVAAVAIAIFYFSLLTTSPSPPDPGPFWDKKLHFAAYAAFAYALAYATAASGITTHRRALLVLGTAIAYGVVLELLQAPLPERYFSYADMVANTVGALLVLAWFAIESRIEYRPI